MAPFRALSSRSTISAIPIPDPELEKRKKLFAYDPSVHDYSESKPSLQDIGHGHYVFGSDAEIEEYKRIRESGTPLKSITILTDEEMEAEAKAHSDVEEDNTCILDTPIHDTGNILYTVGSFIPVIGTIAGFIAGAIFKKHNYIRNYKACKKGAIAGIVTFGAIIGLFGLALLSSLL